MQSQVKRGITWYSPNLSTKLQEKNATRFFSRETLNPERNSPSCRSRSHGEECFPSG